MHLLQLFDTYHYSQLEMYYFRLSFTGPTEVIIELIQGSNDDGILLKRL